MKDSFYVKLVNSNLYLFILFFCVAPKLSSLFLVLFSLLILYGFFSKKINFILNKPSLWLVAFYAIYLFGVFYTNNQEQAFKYVENKLPFLIFPLILSFNSMKLIRFERAGFVLILSVFFLSLIGYWNAIQCFKIQHTIDCFLTISISPIHHPSYFVVFHLISLVFCWKGYYQKWRFFSLKWILPFTIFSIATQFLSLSLAGLLYLFLLTIIVVLFWINRKFGFRIFIIFSLLLPTSAGIIFISVPQFEGEFNGAFKYVHTYLQSPSDFVASRKSEMSGSEVRLVMWTATFSEIMAHPWGVGTGNVDYYLNRRLIQLNQPELAKHNYNPHNQFLQSFLEIGILGVLVLVAFIFHVIIIAWKYRDWALLIIVTNLFFNSLFESMLQRQSGIVFYTFWIVFLLSKYTSLKKQNN
jgi:O-antigen ligase